MNTNKHVLYMAKKRRILALTNTYPTAEMPGDSPQIHDQVEALKSYGMDVDVMYINRYRGKHVYFEAAWNIFLLSFQSKRYDLIHAYYGHCGFLALLQFKYPVVTTFLGSDLLHSRHGMIGKMAARFADGVIVQSDEMKCASNRADACIVPFGVNTRLFTALPMDESRQELGLAYDEKLVLFPWNPARPVKRFDLVQRAIEITRRQYGRVKVLTIYGQPHEIVAKYMSACDVMILVSDHEGSPMALREALACNLPIVSVDVGDVHSLIENVDGCYLCKQEPSDIAEKLCKALERGGRTCGAQIVRRSDAAWGARQVIQLYERVLELSQVKDEVH